jgi:hypothetical protein
MPKLSDTAQAALQAALVTKGPRKGLLLASAPKADTLAYAAWSALMLNVNPYKVGIMGQMFLSPEQRAISNEIESFFMALSPRAQAALRHGLDKDRQALESIGAW